MGWRFDTVVFDCKGCMETILRGSHASMLRADSPVELILIEHDGPEDYDDDASTPYFRWLAAAGFVKIWRIGDTLHPKWKGYSAWRRGGLGGLPTCEQYAAK